MSEDDIWSLAAKIEKQMELLESTVEFGWDVWLHGGSGAWRVINRNQKEEAEMDSKVLAGLIAEMIVKDLGLKEQYEPRSVDADQERRKVRTCGSLLQR